MITVHDQIETEPFTVMVLVQRSACDMPGKERKREKDIHRLKSTVNMICFQWMIQWSVYYYSIVNILFKKVREPEILVSTIRLSIRFDYRSPSNERSDLFINTQKYIP